MAVCLFGGDDKEKNVAPVGEVAKGARRLLGFLPNVAREDRPSVLGLFRVKKAEGSSSQASNI